MGLGPANRGIIRVYRTLAKIVGKSKARSTVAGMVKVQSGNKPSWLRAGLRREHVRARAKARFEARIPKGPKQPVRKMGWGRPRKRNEYFVRTYDPTPGRATTAGWTQLRPESPYEHFGKKH
jgi:hypothetical protein